MSVLVLVRHGMTGATGTRLTGWTPGFHLSDEGRAQAERLAERLGHLPIRAVYSSPLERCRETAQPVARRLGLSIRVRPRLGEVRFGEWTGRTLAQLRRTKLWRRVQLVPSNVRFPGGESFVEVQERAVDELLRIAEAHPEDVVVVVSHADVLKLAIAHFAGMHQDAFQRLVVDPCSVSIVAIGDGTPRVVRVNDTGDLAHLVPSSWRRARAGARSRARPRASAGKPNGRQVRG
jgi:probable phosphomutase (TIGR03848 family)